MKFGTAGVPNCSKDRSTVGGIRTIKELGLDAMEVQFVRGVRMNVERAREVRDVANSLGIELSVHAPYYINLASDEKIKQEQSKKRILDSCERGHHLG